MVRRDFSAVAMIFPPADRDFLGDLLELSGDPAIVVSDGVGSGEDLALLVDRLPEVGPFALVLQELLVVDPEVDDEGGDDDGCDASNKK